MQSAQFQLHAEIEQRHWWFVGRRRILCRLIKEVLGPAGAATIVDVGCGTGANTAALAHDYRCVGIDTSAEAIELARARFPQVQFLTGMAPANLGPLAGEAQLFLLMDVLEHVEDDFALFSSLLSASAPSCCFLVTVPADDSLWSEHDESFGHFRRYDRARLQRLWAGLPVTPLLVSYYNSRLLPLIRLVRGWNRRRSGTAGQAGTDFWLPSRPLNALLAATLAGESRRLAKILQGGTQRGYTAGASLIAIVRREEGPVAIRTKPSDIAPDHRRRVN
jgi:SAM-dependent methyltransferase